MVRSFRRIHICPACWLHDAAQQLFNIGMPLNAVVYAQNERA
jgi:hypothetical protein